MNKKYPCLFLSILTIIGVYFFVNDMDSNSPPAEIYGGGTAEDDEFPSSKEKFIESKSDKPGEFLKYFQDISTRAAESEPGYGPNYRFVEFNKAKKNIKKVNQARVTVSEVTSRGPGNVAGRTRAILIDPGDAMHNTWFAAAASGGVWKTIDGGQSWRNLTPDMPNLSTNSIAMSASNNDIMYVGTGELYATNFSFVRGDGIFKSIDHGETWQQLTSTAGLTDFNSVNRLEIDPSNPNIVVACTNTGIFKTTNGGVSWPRVYNSFGASVQDLDADPSDFNILYAGVNSTGVFKSTDAGSTWSKSSDGISEGIRFEIAVSPTNPSKVYTSTYNNSDETLVYKSADKGATWALADLPAGINGNYLGDQGFYDNIISVHPYDENIAFVGGIYLGKYITTDTLITGTRDFTGVDLEGTQSFLDFVNFNQDNFGGALAIGSGPDPSNEFYTVEVRFGPGKSQKAHRFTVPADAGTNSDGGAGVPDTQYAYQNYTDVPFEVWDIDNNRQLMVSFRDQQGDGSFNLNPRDVNDPNLLASREYLFIHNVDYTMTPSDSIVVGSGSHLYKNMYFFWPVLAPGGTFPPNQQAVMRIKYEEIIKVKSTATIVSDPRGDFGGKNDNLHADHHNLIMIPLNPMTENFGILNGNDGGLGISMNKGESWEQITDGYVTTQFYGADKMPGADEYFGGMQDNGSWRSPVGQTASSTSNFIPALGGDGFEVVWHAQNPQKLMGSIYNNRIFRSIDGGKNFSAAQNGIDISEGPFITRLASSRTSPETVFAVSARGILRTQNFGANWEVVEIVDNWTFTDSNNIPEVTSQHDVEVSLTNDQIIWAGGGMADGIRKMFVSTDGGDNFNPVADYPDAGLGALSGIATHPTEDSTAFSLFSFAKSPKVLRTTDLGQTWRDISGFNTNGNTSSNGFPDVFVHSLLVMPHDTDVIWVGTEIGLFESVDNGLTWAYKNIGVPAVSIWTMKVVDDQVVLGTHGRGIWTVTIPNLFNAQLLVRKGTYLGNREISLEVDLPVAYDEVKLYLNNTFIGTVTGISTGIGEIKFNIEPTRDSIVSFFIEGTIGGKSYRSPVQRVPVDFRPQITSFTQEADELKLLVNVTEEHDSIQYYLNNNYVGSTKDVILGELNVTYTIPGPGEYEAVVIGYYGNLAFGSDTVDLSVSSITAIAEINTFMQFNLFPNPVDQTLNFEVPDGFGNYYLVRIMDTKGREVYSSQLNKYISSQQIHLNYLKKGVYILHLSDGRQSFNQRFIKE